MTLGVLTPAIRNALPLQSLGPLTSDRILEYLGGPSSVAGPRVTHESVMGIPAAYACVRVLAESVAALPLFTFERLEPRGRRKASEHPTYRLLHDAPNPLMTSFQWREMLMGHLALCGNHFSEIETDGRGQVKALWPLNPNRMARPTLSGAGSLIYPYCLPDGQMVELPQRRVLHIRGLSDDGLWGYAPITLEREAFGHALATQEYAARFFGNGARPGGVLQAKNKLGKDSAERMAASWQAAHSGLSMAHRIAVLEEGVEWRSVGMTNEDAQFIETRSFGVVEMARIFRVPPHKIGELSRATFSNIEQQSIEFVTDTLVPWLERIEQQCHKDLFLPNEQGRYYPKHEVNGLLRGDMQARQSFYAAGRQWGWFSADDVRELEDMNPLPDGAGEVYLEPENMRPAGTYQPPSPEPVGVGTGE